MAWSTPRTWVAAELVTASIMNTHVKAQFEAVAARTVPDVDNQKFKFGTGNDVEMYFDGSNFFIDPQAVGSGNIIIPRDNAALKFGAGSDAGFSYDGNDLIVDSALVGSGALSLTRGQIKFPSTQNASSGANTLDDYEDGTWTPTLTGSGGSSGITYDVRLGYYCKIGSLVFIGCYINLSAITSITGFAIVTGLPFTPISTSSQRVFGHTPLSEVVTATGFTSMNAYVESASATMVLEGYASDTTAPTNVVNADLSSAFQCGFSCCYRAA